MNKNNFQVLAIFQRRPFSVNPLTHDLTKVHHLNFRRLLLCRPPVQIIVANRKGSGRGLIYLQVVAVNYTVLKTKIGIIITYFALK